MNDTLYVVTRVGGPPWQITVPWKIAVRFIVPADGHVYRIRPVQTTLRLRPYMDARDLADS